MRVTDREAERLPLMRRVAVLMFLFGGTVCASGVYITQRTDASKLGQALCAAVVLLCGLVLALVRASKRVILATVVVSVLDLAALVAVSNPMGMAPVFFLWPLVYTAYFYSRRTVIVVYAVFVVALGIALPANSHLSQRVDTFVGTTTSVGLMTWLISAMTQREVRLRALLVDMARTDPLTGLMNRRGFDPKLSEMIAAASDNHTPLSVAMFDLDHFKLFNDRYGHLVGDLALQRFADVLREESRDGDAVSRFGGEEFAVALPGAGPLAARAYARRVAAALADHPDDHRLCLSTSAGVTTVEAGCDATKALAIADDALYAAKQLGRARVSWWDGARFADECFDVPWTGP